MDRGLLLFITGHFPLASQFKFRQRTKCGLQAEYGGAWDISGDCRESVGCTVGRGQGYTTTKIAGSFYKGCIAEFPST